jgi:hypothetical protein
MNLSGRIFVKMCVYSWRVLGSQLYCRHVYGSPNIFTASPGTYWAASEPGVLCETLFSSHSFLPPKRVHREEGALRLGKGSREDFGWVGNTEQNKKVGHLL